MKRTVYKLDFQWTIVLALIFAIVGHFWWENLIMIALFIAIFSIIIIKEDR